jgi:hypothetical protein
MSIEKVEINIENAREIFKEKTLLRRIEWVADLQVPMKSQGGCGLS